MIKEICQFVEIIEEQIPNIFEEGVKLKEGVYIALDIGLEDGKYVLKNVDENGNILKEDIGLYKKDEEINPFFEKCRLILQYSTPVSSAKIFNPNKKIFNLTCNPYAIGFTKKIINKNIESIGKDGILEELTQQYFKKAEVFVEEGKAKIWFEGFKSYLKETFWDLLEKIDYASLKMIIPLFSFKKSYY